MKTLIDVPPGESYKLLNNGPLVVITTFDGDMHNAAPIAWVTPVDFEPPLFSAVISSSHKTYENLLKTNECVINVPTGSQIDLIRKLGASSGHMRDKMADIETFASQAVRPVKIAGCLAWIEAKLKSVISKDHDLIILQGIHASALKAALTDDYEYVLGKYPTVHHLGKSFALCTERVSR